MADKPPLRGTSYVRERLVVTGTPDDRRKRLSDGIDKLLADPTKRVTERAILETYKALLLLLCDEFERHSKKGLEGQEVGAFVMPNAVAMALVTYLTCFVQRSNVPPALAAFMDTMSTRVEAIMEEEFGITFELPPPGAKTN